MLQLPNGCRCSGTAGDPKKGTKDQLPVFPANWKTSKASLKKDWYIHYRFYDPNFPEPKLVVLKGMNEFKNLQDRKEYTERMQEDILSSLQCDGYNPFTKMASLPKSDDELHPDLYLVDALRLATTRLKYEPMVLADLDCILNSLDRAIKALPIRSLRVGQTSRKHIAILFEQVAKVNPRFSAKRQNKYRAYMMAMFKVLVKFEAIEHNPMHDIEPERTLTKLRQVLSTEQRIRIDQHLKVKCYRFWLFVHIFFHSGGRETELLLLKKRNVDLEGQKYKCVVKKGRQQKEVERTIKTIAIPYWNEVLQGCGDDQFIFGRLLKPADKKIRPDQIGRRWARYVKGKVEAGGLGINVDFYALKHLNSTEVVELLDNKAAAALNSHTTTAMVDEVYDVHRKVRMHDKLSDLKNKFA